jgi:hypothetical protein
LPCFLGNALCLFAPQLAKLLNLRRPVPRVMVIRISQNLSNALVHHQSPQQLHPSPQILLPVHNDLVPRLRLFLDALAVAKPARISSTSGSAYSDDVCTSPLYGRFALDQ